LVYPKFKKGCLKLIWSKIKKPTGWDPWACRNYTRPRGLDGFKNQSSRILLDGFLEGLQRIGANGLGSWLGSEHLLLAGEGVDAFASLGGGTNANLHLQQARQGEDARALLAKLVNDGCLKGFQNSANLLLGKLSVLGKGGEKLTLGQWFLLVGHEYKLLGHENKNRNILPTRLRLEAKGGIVNQKKAYFLGFFEGSEIKMAKNKAFLKYAQSIA